MAFTPLYRLALVGAFLVAASGCSNGGSSENKVDVVEPVAAPFQEIIDQGVTRYLGEYTPMLSETEGDVVNHSFGVGDGPLCLDGSEFTMATRDQGSSELVIFLQGGGACWSEICAATQSASKGIPQAGILDPELEGNPVGSWSTVYVPYCDGGLHASDADSDSDGDGNNDRFQRGLHNLSASLDVAVNSFPSPSRILLTGISAGGFGTTFALPLVRHLYPGVPIELINDSGVGIARPDEPEFLQLLFRDWNGSTFFPESCDSCAGADGHITDYHKWQLGQDDNFRLGMLSYTNDSVITLTFGLGGGDAFETELRTEMKELEAAYPERVRTFLADGSSHTFLLNGLNVTAGGVTVLDWVTAMLDGSADWISTSD